MHDDAQKSLLLVATAIVATGLAACRPPRQDSASQTQSLDNFAAGKTVTVNSCGYDFRGDQDAPAVTWSLNGQGDTLDLRSRFDGQCSKDHWNDPVCRAAFGVLAAVPAQLAAPFFLGFGGRITVGGEAPCQRPELTAAEKDYASADIAGQTYWCESAGEPAHLYLPADETVIRHSLLRLYAYFYTERFAPTVGELANGGPINSALGQAAAQAFTTMRDGLADKVIEDVGEATEAGQRLAKFRTADHERYANYAFAEMVDSRYCSAQSNAIFQAKFKATYAGFANMAGWPAPAYH
jgi:hypothetical protein